MHVVAHKVMTILVDKSLPHVSEKLLVQLSLKQGLKQFGDCGARTRTISNPM
jgi:hypothetical protein